MAWPRTKTYVRWPEARNSTPSSLKDCDRTIGLWRYYKDQFDSNSFKFKLQSLSWVCNPSVGQHRFIQEGKDTSNLPAKIISQRHQQWDVTYWDPLSKEFPRSLASCQLRRNYAHIQMTFTLHKTGRRVCQHRVDLMKSELVDFITSKLVCFVTSQRFERHSRVG